MKVFGVRFLNDGKLLLVIRHVMKQVTFSRLFTMIQEQNPLTQYVDYYIFCHSWYGLYIYVMQFLF